MVGWLPRIWNKAVPESAAPDSSHSSLARAEPGGRRPIELALQHHQSGRLAEAEALYREVLAGDPEDVDALHFLGVIALQRGDPLRAAEMISRALARNAGNAPAHNNLGTALSAQGKAKEALVCFLDALALQPDYADAMCNLGGALMVLGDPERAAACLRRALAITPTLPEARSRLETLLQDRQRELEALARDEAGLRPDDVDAHVSLGKRFRAYGELDKAVACCQRALLLAPGSPLALYHLGNALNSAGRHGEAIACYRKALEGKPDFPDALVNLGTALYGQGELDEAIACCERALALDARIPEAHFTLGNGRKDQGRFDEAAARYESALALDPGLAAAYVNLGNVVVKQGRPGSALVYFRKAAVLEPGMIEAHYNLGMAAYQAGDFPLAKAALERYLQSQPDDEGVLITLGDAHRHLNELDQARDFFERALKRNPAAAAAQHALANVLRNQGRHADAVTHYRLAIRYDPNSVVAFQSLLFCMMCMSEFSAQQIYESHREFGERFEKPLLPTQRPHENDPDPNRRLRLGYMSPDLRAGIVGDFVEPILKHHDREAFETHCYFTGLVRDSSTERIAARFDHWHDVHALSDEAVAEKIRSDRIDVLVDLCGHAPGNKILVFARKPAPVQVSYLDYSTTTGLASMDYRLTTEYCDPSRTADRYYSEKLYRLAGTYWTYNPSVSLPISALPLKANGYVSFGSFNSYYRITAEVLGVWSRLLQAVPGSRIVVVGVAAGSTQVALREVLARAGITAERISLHTMVSIQKYHELLRTVDVALAPFPYNGTTTMLDCLWNGVPVIAKEGAETFYSRMACSILSELGLSGLIAPDADEYVRIATDLASDVQRMDELRRNLRRKLEHSPLRDFAGFTEGLESAYRLMWRNWCAAQRGRTPRATIHSQKR
jgi:protein O-GlcNAc transferase